MVNTTTMDFNSISAQELFSNALIAFRDSLPSDKKNDFQHFPTAEEMLGELQLYLASAKGRKMERSCNKIAAFSHKLTAYFDVVAAFVQTNPEYAGWFWGCILLVCKIGCNYSGFFERTSEMFEQISTTLPQYRDYVRLCTARDIPNDRLAKSLSLVYADIVDFCQQIYTMLSQRCSGSWKRKVAFVGRVLWSPFNERFGQLLDRMKRHDAIFRQEMLLYDSKIIKGIHERLDIYYEALQKTLSSSFTKIDNMSDFAASETIAKSKDRQVHALKEWIGATDYRTIFENARRRRRAGSGEWFLQNAQYRAWRNAPDFHGSLVVNSQRTPKVGVVQAKPGYGKTFLSSTIIEDLQQQLPTETPSMGETKMPVTAFFHFNRTSNVISNCSAATGFRAILSQLVNLLHYDEWILDTLTVLKGSTGSGQLEASLEDTLVSLALLTKSHPTYLVVDGVDECTDHDILLEALFQLCSSSNCRVLLLGRPDLPFPHQYLNASFSITLKADENFEDILGLVSTELEQLMTQGAFGNRPVSQITPSKAARQANGIFLWAQLFVAYLRSPALTPKARHHFLADFTKFDGLNGLIIAILTRLDEGSQQSKDMALRIFNWVGAAFYPLSTEALHTALAITPGEEITDLDYLVDFPDCLPILTGALVEIDLFGRPAFIHLSIRELLTSSRFQIPASFSLADSTAIHGRLTNFCLSYLTHDIPKRPVWALVAGQSTGEDSVLTEKRGSQSTLPDAPTFDHPDSVRQPVLQQEEDHILRREYGDPWTRKRFRPESSEQQWYRDRDHQQHPDQGQLKRQRYSGSPWPEIAHPRPELRPTSPTRHHMRPESFRPMVLDTYSGNHLNQQRTESSLKDVLQGRGRGALIEESSPAQKRPQHWFTNSQDDENMGEYPFLRYATLCWVQHTWASFHARHRNPAPQTHILSARRDVHPLSAQIAERLRDPLPLWTACLSQFLFCKPAVTNWTESSFHYNWTPSLRKVILPMKELISEVPQDTPENRELHWISLGLDQLAKALDELAQKHRSRLHSNPTLIWQRDIMSATDEMFWPVWANEELTDNEGMPNVCWTGEKFLPGHTLDGLASSEECFSRVCN